MAAQAPACRVVLGEWSDGALKICRQNIRRNSLTARVVPMQTDAREKPDKSLGEFQCIVSNPPYIPRADIDTLDASVKDYEPHLALDGGEDGLDFYHTISEKWKEVPVPGGRLYFEVGIGQADSVLRIMRAQGFGDIQVVKDLHDIPGWYSAPFVRKFEKFCGRSTFPACIMRTGPQNERRLGGETDGKGESTAAFGSTGGR